VQQNLDNISQKWAALKKFLMTIMSIRSELDNLGKTAAACKTIINDCVIEIESSTAK
jgi:hypothetical protein